jgi:hypothetical protein
MKRKGLNHLHRIAGVRKKNRRSKANASLSSFDRCNRRWHPAIELNQPASTAIFAALGEFFFLLSRVTSPLSIPV